MPAESAQDPTGPRRAALIFILLTVMFDTLALGIIIPVFPKLVIDFVGGDIAYAATMVGIMGTVWAVMQFFFSPVQGALSDRFGRRPILLISLTLASFSTRRVLAFCAYLALFHLHLVLDYFGSGPGWPICLPGRLGSLSSNGGRRWSC